MSEYTCSDLKRGFAAAKDDGWISVQERMPDNDEYVLCCNRAGIFTCHYSGLEGFTAWYTSTNIRYGLNFVTHWHHLPDLPKY